MSITTTSTGSNSALIEWEVGDTQIDIATEIETFILAHGWEAVDPAWWSNTRTYRALNKDGTTYKYMQFYINSLYLYMKCYESYDEPTQVGTNLTYDSDVANYSQKIPVNSFGWMRVFSTNRWMCMFGTYNDTLIGSTTGLSFTGVFETTKVNPLDTCPDFVWLNGYRFATSYVSSPRTLAQTGYSAARYNMMVTPAGGWGYAYHTINLANAFPGSINPFTSDHHVYDITLNFDCDVTAGIRYTKGKIYGLKVTERQLLQTGETLTTKCDADLFLDAGGVDTDYFILTDNTNNTFAIPL